MSLRYITTHIKMISNRHLAKEYEKNNDYYINNDRTLIKYYKNNFDFLNYNIITSMYKNINNNLE